MRHILRLLPILLAALCGCGSTEVSITEPPEKIHGGWLRSSVTEAGPDAVPESIRSLKAAKIWRAEYRGPQDMKGVWILYPSQTVAFEALQKLNKSAGVWPIQIGALFLVLDAKDVPRQSLGDFQEGVAKALP